MDRGCGCLGPAWPPGCEAYVALGTFTPGGKAVIFSPQQWCARPLLVGERVWVGDEHGRRAQAFVLGESAHPDEPSMAGYDFLVDAVEQA